MDILMTQKTLLMKKSSMSSKECSMTKQLLLNNLKKWKNNRNKSSNNHLNRRSHNHIALKHRNCFKITKITKIYVKVFQNNYIYSSKWEANFIKELSTQLKKHKAQTKQIHKSKRWRHRLNNNQINWRKKINGFNKEENFNFQERSLMKLLMIDIGTGLLKQILIIIRRLSKR